MLQITCHHKARSIILLLGLGHDRLDTGAVGQLPDSSVIGLISRRKGSTCRSRIGYAIIGRVGLDKSRIFCAVECRRGIPRLDLKHRHVTQTHAVADHVDNVLHLGILTCGLLGLDAVTRHCEQQYHHK